MHPNIYITMKHNRNSTHIEYKNRGHTEDLNVAKQSEFLGEGIMITG